MRRHLFILLTITVLALILRIIYALDLPVSGDESVSLMQATGAMEYKQCKPVKIISIQKLQQLITYSDEYGPGDVVKSMKCVGAHPPVYYLILHYTMRFFGNEAFTLRMLSIFFSTVSVLMLYLLAKEIFSPEVGLLSSLF